MYQKNKLAFNLSCIFLVVFFVTTKFIRFYLPDPLTLYSELRSEKIEMINRLADSSNVAIFGNSHINSGFDPRAFDNEAKKNGFNLKSLNLGLPGGSHTEVFHLAKKFMSRKTKALDSEAPQLIILEITNGVNFPPGNQYTTRSVNIYDYETTRLAFSLKNFNTNDIEKSIGQKAIALSGFILNSLNTGMLSNYIFLNKNFDPNKLSEMLENDKRGYGESLRKATASEIYTLLNDKAFLGDPRKFLFINNEKIIEALLQEKNSKNFKFSFIAAPKLDKKCIDYPEALTVHGHVVPIFNFTCLKKNPELFEIQNWSDPGHLNYYGAQKMSSLLAKKVTQWLKKGFN